MSAGYLGILVLRPDAGLEVDHEKLTAPAGVRVGGAVRLSPVGSYGGHAQCIGYTQRGRPERNKCYGCGSRLPERNHPACQRNLDTQPQHLWRRPARRYARKRKSTNSTIARPAIPMHVARRTSCRTQGLPRYVAMYCTISSGVWIDEVGLPWPSGRW